MNKQDYLDLKAAKESKNWWVEERRAIFNYLMTKYIKKNNLKLLEIGSGSGINMDLLSKYGQAFGIDNSKASIKLCRSLGYNVKLGSATSIPFDSGFFDFVLFADVLEHISDQEKAIKEAKRVLKKNGLILISVPAYQMLFSYHDTALGHKRRYSKENLIHLFKEDKILFMSYIFSFALIPLILYRNFNKLTNKKKADNLKLPNFFNFIFMFFSKIELNLIRFFPILFGTSIICMIRKTGD